MKDFEDNRSRSTTSWLVTALLYLVLPIVPIVLLILWFRMHGCCSFG